MEFSNGSLSTVLAVTSGFLFALSIQLQNLGLQKANPRVGAVVSIAATTLVYWLAAPFLLEPHYWLTWGTICFFLVGLFRPALSVNFAMASVKYMGPTLTSAIAATNPIFGAAFAIIILGEILTLPIACGTLAVVLGIIIGSLKSGNLGRNWPLWALSLPLGAAFFRASGHPLTMVGYETVPSPYFAGLVSYSTSFVIAMTVYGLQKHKLPKLTANYTWFAIAGVVNGISLYSLNYALKIGQLLTVSPIVACSPVFTMLLGAFVFKKEVITWQIIAAMGSVTIGVIIVASRWG